MIWRFIVVAIVIAAAFYGLHTFQGIKEKMISQAIAQQQAGGSITISAEEAKAATWQDRLESVGSLQAVQGTDLAPEVAGVVTSVNFSSGQDVAKGTLLVEINDSVEEAALTGEQASAAQARKQFERYQTLAKRGDQSQSSLDEQRAAWQQAQSSVDQTEAQIAQKNILAPFDGRLGIRQVNLGQYVSAGTVLVTLQDLNSIYVNFSMPAQHLAKLKVGLELDVTTDAYPGETFKAKLTSLDAVVDQATRNITVQGTLPNPDRKLLPGLFVNVRVLLPASQEVITVPETAITYSLFGDSVYLVEGSGDQQTVKQIFVTVGARRGDEVAISGELKAGDMVVTSGQTKLRNGTAVKVNNSVSLGPRSDLPRG
ncbi:MAG: efflux RND transporter periplasmic adaptor subunit [Sneathiellaceae bacterium]